MRFLLPVVASMLTLGFACGGGEEASDEPEDEKTEADAKDESEKDDEKDDGNADAAPPRGKRKGKASKAGRGVPFADAKVVCCDHDRINKAMTEYLDVHENLVNNQPSTGDANALWGHLSTAADDASLPRATRDASRRAADELTKFRDEDNATMQKHFSVVGYEMRTLVNNHKGKGDHSVAYTVCPMGGGAYWYQTATTVQNPFGGTETPPNCGHFEP